MKKCAIIFICIFISGITKADYGQPFGQPDIMFPNYDDYYDPNEICQLPKVVGHCRAGIKRWWYNSQKKDCEFFLYGGCGQNANNFRTYQECMDRCQINGNVCRLPEVKGSCKASFRRWRYNPTNMACEEFTYGGCGKNGNNFRTYYDCYEHCATVNFLKLWQGGGGDGGGGS